MRPLVYAHRGGAALAPENTIAAFDHGLAVGADGLELDVRLAADGVPVVIHDATLDRTTNATGPVAARASGELAALDAGYRFAVEGGFPCRARGIGVPRLDEVLRRYPETPLIIEFKEDSAALAKAAVDAVRAAGAIERTVLASFRTGVLLAVRRLSREIRTGPTPGEVRSALMRSWCGLAPRNPAYVSFQIPETWGRLRVVSRRFVRAAARANLPVHVWVVNAESDMRRLLDWGVSGLVTDRPDIAVPLVRALRPAP